MGVRGTQHPPSTRAAGVRLSFPLLTLQMASSESIHFDEYMESGIPSSLLKGLGFRDEGSTNEIKGSSDEVHGEDERDCTGSILKAESTAGVTLSPRPLMRKHKVGRIAQQTIIKGNIIYKRTESGGMVASLMKSDDSPIVEALDKNQNTPKQRARKTAPSTPFQLELPYNCPINENNVGTILDKSIFATQGIRGRLITLKDDLRRQGGGPQVTSQLKPVHMKRRDEIAKQLTILYIDYQEALDNICNVVEALSEVHVPPASSLSASSSLAGKHSFEGQPEDSPRLKHLRPNVKGHKKGSAGASDDLWMSCEPGSDDELQNRFKYEQKIFSASSKSKSSRLT